MTRWPSLWIRLLLRELTQMRSAALAVAAVVAAGIGVWVMSQGMIGSLEQTRRAYYTQYGFADLFVQATRIPVDVVHELQQLPGARRVEGRVHGQGKLVFEGGRLLLSATVLSQPAIEQDALQRFRLVAGRRVAIGEPAAAVVIRSFATARGLRLGDQLALVINGRAQRVRIVGLAMAPEFVYALPPGEIIPDPARFAALWMDPDSLSRAFDLDGAFNEVLLRTAIQTKPAALRRGVDALLRPYGGAGAYGREFHPSDQFLRAELQQLRTMGHILPPLFLLVAVFLLHTMLGRMVRTQREQIGLLKALGYRDRRVAAHYLAFALLITALGALIGVAIGQLLGQGLARLYQQYFQFPFLLFTIPFVVHIQAVALSAVTGAVAVAGVVLEVATMPPAVAMQPPVPPAYRHGNNELTRRLDPATRMLLRHIGRWPRRSLTTAAGVAVALSLLIGVGFTTDASRYMVDSVYRLHERAHATVQFRQPTSAPVIDALRARPGILKAEPYRAVPVEFHAGPRRRRGALIGLPDEGELNRPRHADGRPVALDVGGLVLSDKLAELLAVAVGDPVEVQVTDGRRQRFAIPVARIYTTYLGTPAYISLRALWRELRESGSVSGAHIVIDPAQREGLVADLGGMPTVLGLRFGALARAQFQRTLDETVGTFTAFNALFAAVIVFGVMFSALRVTYAERARELAGLRVLGYTRAEVGAIVIGEVAVLMLLAIGPGLLLGTLLARGMSAAMSSELYRIPFVVAPATYGLALLVVVGAALGTALLVYRRMGREDLVATLKTRD